MECDGGVDQGCDTSLMDITSTMLCISVSVQKAWQMSTAESRDTCVARQAMRPHARMIKRMIKARRVGDSRSDTQIAAFASIAMQDVESLTG